jgi:hypothetical protein
MIQSLWCFVVPTKLGYDSSVRGVQVVDIYQFFPASTTAVHDSHCFLSSHLIPTGVNVSHSATQWISSNRTIRLSSQGRASPRQQRFFSWLTYFELLVFALQKRFHVNLTFEGGVEFSQFSYPLDLQFGLINSSSLSSWLNSFDVATNSYKSFRGNTKKYSWPWTHVMMTSIKLTRLPPNWPGASDCWKPKADNIHSWSTR